MFIATGIKEQYLHARVPALFDAFISDEKIVHYRRAGMRHFNAEHCYVVGSNPDSDPHLPGQDPWLQSGTNCGRDEETQWANKRREC